MISRGIDGSDVFPPYHSIGMNSRKRSSTAATSMTTSMTTVMTSNSPSSVVPPVRAIAASPIPRRPPLRSDRLYSRLRSNSGLALHTNEAALEQYINYQNSGPARPPSSTSAPQHDALYEEDGGADLAETCSQSSRGDGSSTPGTGLRACIPFLDFLGQGVFQMSLDNPAISSRLLKYCEDHGCEENLEFLMKIQEYTQATDEVASVLTSIATTFTSPAAKSPLNLPPLLSRQLNVDMKRMAHTILPGMESVFVDATRHIKKRIAREAFPGFVQTQFTHCASVALSSGICGIGSPKLEYPGLGESFCISKASNPNSVVTAASDALSTITGYPLAEIISRNCSFMQGPFTDQAAVQRIRTGLREGHEVAELMINYRRDGEPFWNLFTLFPLKDQQGQLQYWLGSQIDISESINSRRDLMRVLNRGRNPDAPTEANSIVGSIASSEMTDNRGEKSFERDDTPMSREGSLRSNSRSGFLQQFRKMQRSPSPPPTPTAERNHYRSGPTSASRGSNNAKQPTQDFLPRARAPSIPPVCAHYVVLSCEQFAPSSAMMLQRQAPLSAASSPTGTAAAAIGIPSSSSSSSSSSRKKQQQQSLKLNVAFYSDAAAELLSIRGDATRLGIFQVLEDHANSPSITKSFKSLVRERIEFGKSVSAEIMVERSRNHHGGGGGGGGFFANRRSNRHTMGGGVTSGGSFGGGSSASGSRPGSATEFDHHHRSGSGDKLERKMMSWGSSKQEKLMTHWTPLKDANGDVEWVILILAPRVAA